MSTSRIASCFPVMLRGCAGILLWSCSSDDSRPAPTGMLFGTGGAGASAANDGGDAGPGGTAGWGGQAAGGAAGQPPATCGNGVIEESESCDGIDLDGQSCASLGFDGGVLGCGLCEFDLSGCTGVERCYDGQDNDGDGDVDCADADCAAGCADPCAAPAALADPSVVQGDTWGHADTMTVSCAPQAGAADLVFAFTPASSGVVEATLTSQGTALALAARTSCEDGASELACRDFESGQGAVERLLLPAQQGIPLFLVVDGAESGQTGAFELAVLSRPVLCGDASLDPVEECDDGNSDPGDGCGADCTLESSESEPNDTIAQADPFAAQFTGVLAPAGDVDVIVVELAHPASNLVVDTFDLGNGGCYLQLMDTIVDIVAPDATTVVATDDDSGSGYCAHVAAGGLAPGTYFMVIRAGGASAQTFPYRLSIAEDWCGNGVQSDVEECDDGNMEPGDGCGPGCVIE